MNVIPFEDCISMLKDKVENIDNIEMQILLLQSVKVIEHQKMLLEKLYDSASKVDLEYCTILNNYDLVPAYKNGKPYKMDQDYDNVWMEDFIAVEEHLGI